MDMRVAYFIGAVLRERPGGGGFLRDLNVNRWIIHSRRAARVLDLFSRSTDFWQIDDHTLEILQILNFVTCK